MFGALMQCPDFSANDRIQYVVIPFAFYRTLQYLKTIAIKTDHAAAARRGYNTNVRNMSDTELAEQPQHCERENAMRQQSICCAAPCAMSSSDVDEQ